MSPKFSNDGNGPNHRFNAIYSGGDAEGLLNDEEKQAALMAGLDYDGIQADEDVDAIVGEGEFGRCEDNPIPVNGWLGEPTYLSGLTTDAGEKIFFHCYGRLSEIGIYETVSADGKWDLFFFSPYHLHKTKRAPEGCKRQPTVTALTGITYYCADFPWRLNPFLEKYAAGLGLPADPDASKIAFFKRPPEQEKKLRRLETLYEIFRAGAALMLSDKIGGDIDSKPMIDALFRLLDDDPER